MDTIDMVDSILSDNSDNNDVLHPGASAATIQHVWINGEWREAKKPLIREAALTIYVNKMEMVTLLCTPSKLNYLVIGFVILEGIAHGIDDISLVRVCNEEREAEVLLAHSPVELPTRRTLTSGCGGGVSFAIESLGLTPVASEAKISAADIQDLVKQFQENATLYRLTGGVHMSALAEPGRLVAVAEDVGRHNTLDKIYGECQLTGAETEGRILLTTGRVSSEMLIKAVKMKVPIVVSRTAATDEAVRLANELNVTLIGYARGARITLYAHPWRISDFGRVV
ncbi:MAG: formate dehydrogenase accessory sulfurtransferase FdhD [Chloroflexi bacterium]|nr:formate dehydrogenase accessory sulfurtransferase FdhD [Chloroflexota bacterium]